MAICPAIARTRQAGNIDFMDEFDRIARYFAPLARAAGAHGLRDDVATLAETGRLSIITTDCLVESVHFLPGDPIGLVAQKLVRVNVSDCLAKGALPKEALLTLGWPAGRDERHLEEFATALGDELRDWDVELIGGDSVTVPGGLFASLTLTGRCLSSGGPVLRSGARPGEDFWVTGEIGWGHIGLEAARSGGDPAAAERYRVPVLPPKTIPELVATTATASMDVSDGLIGDLIKLCSASEVSADLHLDHVPFAVAPKDQDERLTLATAGDDYQVLFAAPVSAREPIAAWSDATDSPITRIGTVQKGSDLRLFDSGEEIPLPPRAAFVHS